jgi:hypothetical protein
MILEPILAEMQSNGGFYQLLNHLRRKLLTILADQRVYSPSDGSQLFRESPRRSQKEDV